MGQFSLDDFLPYQLAVIASRVSKEFSEIYKEKFALSVPEWRVLAQLGNAKTPLSVRDLCLLTDLEKSKVSRAITRLQARGFVAKAAGTIDKRLVAVKLTPSGQQVIATLAPLADRFEQDLLAKLGAEAPAFRAALRAMLDDAR